MASEIYYLTGTTGFSALDSVDKFGNYSCQVYLDPESEEIYDESGMMLRKRKDDDGKESITFRRPPVKQTRDGRVIEFGAPQVINTEGEDFSNPSRIGRGTKVTIKVSAYPVPDRGKGHCLEAVRVDELVERGSASKTVTPASMEDVPF